jgi:MscS family membrane protein
MGSGQIFTGMKLNSQFIHRFRFWILLMPLLWAVGVSAQPAASTNAPSAGAATNAPLQPMPTPEWIKSLSVDYPFLTHQVWSNELWKYLFSLIYIFLAFGVSKLLDFLTRVWLKRWAEKTKTRFDDLVLELLNGPVKIVSFVILLRIGLDVFKWPETVHMVLNKVFTLTVAISITYMVLKFVDLLMGYWRQRVRPDPEHHHFDQQLFPIIRKSLKLFVVVIAALVTLDNMGVNITAAIASLSIGGLAVGLAAQDTLANLFGAVAIFGDKPFKLGDRIQLDDLDGSVESIGMRSTRVRSLDGYLVTIPNKTMGNATIVNITRRPTIKTEMNFGLTYDTSSAGVLLAVKILEEIYGAHEHTKDLIVSFNKFGDSGLNIMVLHWWDGAEGKPFLAAMQQLNLQVKDRFEKEGLDLAFPTQTLYLKRDPAKGADKTRPRDSGESDL